MHQILVYLGLALDDLQELRGEVEVTVSSCGFCPLESWAIFTLHDGLLNVDGAAGNAVPGEPTNLRSTEAKPHGQIDGKLHASARATRENGLDVFGRRDGNLRFLLLWKGGAQGEVWAIGGKGGREEAVGIAHRFGGLCFSHGIDRSLHLLLGERGDLDGHELLKGVGSDTAISGHCGGRKDGVLGFDIAVDGCADGEGDLLLSFCSGLDGSGGGKGLLFGGLGNGDTAAVHHHHYIPVPGWELLGGWQLHGNTSQRNGYRMTKLYTGRKNESIKNQERNTKAVRRSLQKQGLFNPVLLYRTGCRRVNGIAQKQQNYNSINVPSSAWA